MTYNQLRWWSSIPREPGAQLGIYNSSSTATTFDTDPRALVFGHPPNLNQRHASLVPISDFPTTCRPILFLQLLLYANAVFRTSISNLGGVCRQRWHIRRLSHCLLRPRLPPHRPGSIGSYATRSRYLVLPPRRPSASALPPTNRPPSVTLNSLSAKEGGKAVIAFLEETEVCSKLRAQTFDPDLCHRHTCPPVTPTQMSSLRTVVLPPLLNFGLPISCHPTPLQWLLTL